MPDPANELQREPLAPTTVEIEAPPQPEARVEALKEQEQKIEIREEGAIEKAAEAARHILRRPKKPAAPLPPQRDELSRRVEKIMEENIGDAYLALDPVHQQEFKLAGERTAYAISQLLKKTHVKVKKIFSLLFAWLKLLPGINRYFLEQEAKIKADKILALKYRSKDS